MEELQSLEDGEKVSDFVKTWSETRLRVRDSAKDADVVATGGETFQVRQVEDRTTSGGFVRAILRRLP
jgi:hypothetical protein